MHTSVKYVPVVRGTRGDSARLGPCICAMVCRRMHDAMTADHAEGERRTHVVVQRSSAAALRDSSVREPRQGKDRQGLQMMPQSDGASSGGVYTRMGGGEYRCRLGEVE